MKRLCDINLDQAVPEAEDVAGMVAVTHAELLAARNDGRLRPGRRYRITDYAATTNGDMNSRSANRPFDIVVVADDVDVLNENAHAIRHEGDTYFANSNLAAWKVKYCLDNDTNRFAWAVADDESGMFDGDAPFVGGRGVVYRLVDEFGNDVPYDFKGLQFQRWAITGVTSTKLTPEAVTAYTNQFVYASNGGKCFAYKNSNISVNDTVMTVDSSTSAYYYTFDSGSGTDYSLSGGSQSVYGNKMREYLVSGKAKLNSIVFLGSGCYSNTFGDGCHSNTFGNHCRSNTFGNYCESDTFGNSCRSNTFGNSCYSNTFGNYCYSNTFGNECFSNTFGNSCTANTFGIGCYYNTFGNECYYNTFGIGLLSNTFGNYCYSNTFGNKGRFITFGNSCDSNTFGDYFDSNKFGNSCDSNTFGDYCESNTFGNECRFNTFGDYCNFITFGNECNSNTFGNGCAYITFGTSSAPKSYCRYITVESGNKYIYLNPTGTTSSSAYYQNVTIKSGVNNTETYKTITDPNVKQDFHTTYKPANSQEISI